VTQSAFQDVVKASTEGSPADGFSLLKEELWLTGFGFHPGVQGYLAGLPAGTDWAKERWRIEELVRERIAQTAPAEKKPGQRTRELEIVDLAVARNWARHDLGEAVYWYANELTSDGWLAPETPRVVRVLSSVSNADVGRVVDWIQSHRAGPDWDDQIVVEYMRGKAHVAPNADLEYLVSLPAQEEDRARIVAAFASPREKNGEQVLRHSREHLDGLIRAAGLSVPETDRWLGIIAGATPPGSR
jgi:hypothetical protein